MPDEQNKIAEEKIMLDVIKRVEIKSHCGECINCRHDCFFEGYRCVEKMILVRITSPACKDFILRRKDDS